MAYNGYLIKAGNYKIPLKYIKAETYSITMNGQDLDSYRDADGDLHRQALPNPMWKVEFETVPLLNEEEKTKLMSKIQENYKDKVEKSLMIEAFDPEYGRYIQQLMYVPDISFSMYFADEKEIKYNSFRIAFIGAKKAVKV